MAQQEQLEINQQSKQVLLALLNETVILADKKMPFMIATHHLMANLKRCYNKQQKRLLYPELESRLLM